MKLSGSQKEVIERLRSGGNLGCNGFDDKRVPSHTIESIRRLKLIEFEDGTIFTYRLTELGKTIEL